MTHNICPHCRGTGVEPDSDRKKHNSPRIGRPKFEETPCSECNGTGEHHES